MSLRNEAPAAGRSWLRRSPFPLASLLLLVTLASRAGRHGWRLELLSHFALQYLAAGVLLLLLSWWTRARYAALFAMLSVAINAMLVVPLYRAPSIGDAIKPEAKLRVCSFNILGDNSAYDDAVAYLRQAPCDVLMVLEVRPEWLAALRKLKPEYRVEIARPRQDNFGIALLSRNRTVKARVLSAPARDIDFIEAEVMVDGEAWSILGVHPVPPVSEHHTQLRNTDLDFMAQWTRTKEGPTIVIGDLNITPFSPYFAELLSGGELLNSQIGFGMQPSWPERPQLLAPLRIPIDHALHSRHLVTLERSLGPAHGSDHRPLLLTFGRRR